MALASIVIPACAGMTSKKGAYCLSQCHSSPSKPGPTSTASVLAYSGTWFSTSQYSPTCLTAHTNCSKSTGLRM